MIRPFLLAQLVIAVLGKENDSFCRFVGVVVNQADVGAFVIFRVTSDLLGLVFRRPVVQSMIATQFFRRHFLVGIAGRRVVISFLGHFRHGGFVGKRGGAVKETHRRRKRQNERHDRRTAPPNRPDRRSRIAPFAVAPMNIIRRRQRRRAAASLSVIILLLLRFLRWTTPLTILTKSRPLPSDRRSPTLFFASKKSTSARRGRGGAARRRRARRRLEGGAGRGR